MTVGDIETYPQDGLWHSRIEGRERPFASAQTKVVAVELGQEKARELQVEHLVRNADGTVGWRDRYGSGRRDVPV